MWQLQFELFFESFPHKADNQEEDPKDEEVDERKRKTCQRVFKSLTGKLRVVKGGNQQSNEGS